MTAFFKKRGLATLVAASALASVLAGASNAHAALVTEWGYTVTSEWTGATFSSGGGSQVNNATQISWGGGGPLVVGGDRSGVVISNPSASGAITTNGGTPAPTQTITHTNNPISGSYATLLTAGLSTTLTLNALTPPTPGTVNPAPISFNIKFAETPNVANCPFPSGSSCDDIFVISFGSLNNSFVFDGLTYYTSIVTTLGALTPLDAASCNAAGAGPGCLGFQTPEGAATPVQFGFLITSEPVNVPEPGVLSLLAMAMLGATVAARRRKL